jgi:glycosyltransferase involved in cell wall biosynthesis
MDQPRVTIAMSVLNAASTVGFAVRSIVEQTYANWELIVLDDGSTDATPEIVRSFADTRIRLVRDGRNLGLAARLNQIIASAAGKYIARMDADDVAYPDRLLRQVRYLEANPDVDLVGTSAVVFAGNGDTVGVFPVETEHAKITARPDLGFVLPHPTWLGRREWFARFGYRESARRAQDQDLLLRAHRASRFANLPEVLLGYRQETPTARNILRGRWHYTRGLWRFAAEHEAYGMALRGTALQALRALATVALVAIGQGDALLRRRFRAVAELERERWQTLWAHLASDGPAEH